ncbi:MAG: hypothetical protein JXB34_09345 [Bacteroidales bacterium]|nr:hypothetical protein [Bacteroidales bacterium]
MVIFLKPFGLFFKGSLFERLPSKSERLDFYKETGYINFMRLKGIVVAAFTITLLMLIVDFSSGDFWDKQTTRRFIIVDSAFFIFFLFPLFIVLFRNPKDKNGIQPYHVFVTRLTQIVILAWCAIVSANEWPTANGMPTFIIGVFVVCSVFIDKSWFVALTLITGLLVLVVFLSLFNIEYVMIVQHYFSSVSLVIIAFIISRILMANNIKTYTAKLMLENTNACLDDLVKSRTEELESINERLTAEVQERQKKEEQLEAAKERAEESDRLKTSFLANMSHEIRTPLNGIVGFSDLLQRAGLIEEKRSYYAGIIKSNSRQLLKIIDDIIDISMIESNQLKFNHTTVTLQQIVNSSAEMVNALKSKSHNKSVEFNVLLDESIATVEMNVDACRVQQVLNSLLDNALKYTIKGTITLLTRLDGNHVFFCVDDTGTGIKPEKADIVFERFMQLGKQPIQAAPGTGLGLAISAGIVQALNGNIWLDFSYTKGARFCFSLPLQQPRRKKKLPVGIKVSSKLSEGKTIAIVAPGAMEFQFLSKLFLSGKLLHKKSPGECSGGTFHLILTSMLMNGLDSGYLQSTPLIQIIDPQELGSGLVGLVSENCFYKPLNLCLLVQNIETMLSLQAPVSL